MIIYMYAKQGYVLHAVINFSSFVFFSFTCCLSKILQGAKKKTTGQLLLAFKLKVKFLHNL